MDRIKQTIVFKASVGIWGIGGQNQLLIILTRIQNAALR